MILFIVRKKYEGPEEQSEPPTKDWAWEIKRTKNNRSSRKDNISAELTKYGDKKLWEEIHALLEVIGHYK
jgi:hypothetical protein